MLALGNLQPYTILFWRLNIIQIKLKINQIELLKKINNRTSIKLSYYVTKILFKYILIITL